ncbi:FmtA-like protein [Clostridium gelidum]|uniref:FmtA-like protein n=1 Tax=Clostridium gelidum TaxID=704125 RepID=A0ABN6ITD3_9CLOT|nr:serine hydrolase [Clostridium gelidum]BCZ45460.1 FmtA-like protein [Clostridium gelidum]
MNIILKKLKRIIGVLLTIFLISIGLSNNFILKEVKAEEESNEVYRVISNEEDVNNFMNNYFKENMEKYLVPGAAVVVIKDGKEIFKKGYGYSDVENDVLVDPDKTTFPLGSVSKLFTATAIMKLYEDGKIDLDENVNNYIKPFSVNNPYCEPVTCANLLTHASGVDEESELDIGTFNKNDIKSQQYFISKHLPKVVREPNTVSRYSNEGYGLLGYVIENASGESYQEYVQKNILDVLGMKNSYIRAKNETMAKAYAYDDGKYKFQDWAYEYNLGASGIIATATDMEKFMQAHLNKDQINGQSMLKPETEELMQKKEFSNNDDLSGMGYGFIRSDRNNKLVLKHEGALPVGYTTSMFLVPEENLGVYIATNSLGALPFDFEEAFLNHFYPAENNKFEKVSPKADKDYSEYAGSYRSYDACGKSNLMKFFSFSDPDMTIENNNDGTLTLKECTSAKEEVTTKLVEYQDGVFARQDGKGDFAFRKDNGKVTYAFNDVSHNSFEKLSFYEGRIFNIAILLGGIITFTLNILLNAVKYIRRLFKKNKEKLNIFDKLNLANVAIGILNIVGFVGSVMLAQAMVISYDSSFMMLLYILLGILVAGTIVSVIQLVIFIIILFKKKRYHKEKVYLAVINIVNLAFIFSAYYANILGFKVY